MSGTTDVPEAAQLPNRSSLTIMRLRRAGVTTWIGLAVLVIFVIVGLFAPLIAPFDPFAVNGPSLAAPSQQHLLGTDALGRDLFSSIIYGTRTSLLLGLVAGLLVLAIGGVIGVIAGFFGGWIDDVLMRLTEFVQVLPRFFLALVVISLFGPGIDRLAIVLGVTSWTTLARVVRSEVLSLRGRDFVAAARADGATSMQIMGREIVPNVLPTAIVYVGLVIAQILLIEAGLGFLGLGDPNQVSLGFLASQAQRFLRVAWWLSVFPGATLVLIVLGFNLVADGLGGGVPDAGRHG